MNLDIEKIKAALQVINAYINDGSMLPQDMSHPYFQASDSLDYLILALKAYDPDAIRRECREKVYQAWLTTDAWKDDLTLSVVCAAIMNAGKE